jgi:hypothetical protein
VKYRAAWNAATTGFYTAPSKKVVSPKTMD